MTYTPLAYLLQRAYCRPEREIINEINKINVLFEEAESNFSPRTSCLVWNLDNHLFGGQVLVSHPQ